MDKSDILKGFNNHLSEFVDDLNETFPDNDGVKSSKIALNKIRKANPKLLIEIFKKYVYIYKQEINAGNLETFLEKDYNYDLRNTPKDTREYIIYQIDTLRKPIELVAEEGNNREKATNYMKNLIKLCEIYYNL